jgi:hypothetical protein
MDTAAAVYLAALNSSGVIFPVVASYVLATATPVVSLNARRYLGTQRRRVN